MSIYHNIKNFRDKYIFEDETVIEKESDLDKILKTDNKIKSILVKLFSQESRDKISNIDDIKDIVVDIRCIQKKPSTFRIYIKNNAYLDIKYLPTPQQEKNPEDYNKFDGFIVTISGKKYRIAIRSEYQQCLQALGTLMSEKPLLKDEDTNNSSQGDDSNGGEEIGSPEAPEEDVDDKKDDKEEDK